MRCAGRAVELGQQLLGALAAVQQHGDAAAVLGDVAQAGVQVPGVHVAAHLECVQHGQGLVHAHGHAVVLAPGAAHQRDVDGLAGAVAEGVGDEFAGGRLQRAGAHLLHQRFVAAAVLDEVGDGADLQAVLGGELLQVGQAGHGAVVLHDLADDGGRAAAGHGGQVAAGFGVAGAHEHAAIDRLQREDVAGLHQVGGLGIRCHGGLHGAGAVGGGDAGGDALGGLDGGREGRAHLGAVARHHGWQAQQFAALAREGEADEAAAETRHEVDRFGRDVVGCQDQVAFVFAVFLVHEDDDAPGAHLRHDVFDGRDGCEGEGGVHGGGLSVVRGGRTAPPGKGGF